MNRIIILNEELESQMHLYLVLCEQYRVEIAEDEATLMRMIRRKKPRLVLLDAAYSGFNNNGKSVFRSIEKIKRKYEQLKIITIFDREEPSLISRAEKSGSDGVLLRPLEECDVLERVATQLNMPKAVCT
ncbi:MAG TPA: response regulator [Bacteroidetes bacterium]|nr:response regulator [Bacteroidota bacterium]